MRFLRPVSFGGLSGTIKDSSLPTKHPLAMSAFSIVQLTVRMTLKCDPKCKGDTEPKKKKYYRDNFEIEYILQGPKK